MSKIVVSGGNKLSGEVMVHGAKNSVLPILAATILNADENIIHDCPDIKDVAAALKILETLGCSIKREKDTVIINSATMNNYTVPDHLMREMRSSVIFLGPIISRYKKAILTYPGGCEIGHRPIDLHLKALRQLNIKIIESHGYICCYTDKVKSNDINLNFPSVGATENIILTAVKGSGTTIIRNAAKEPEIVDLQNFLNRMGAKVYGGGTSIITIEGVDRLNNVEYTVIPDRIVASTYLVAAAITGSNIEVKNVNVDHIQAILSVLRECGCNIIINNNSLIIDRKNKLQPLNIISTLPYPGFPTDMQAPLIALLSLAQGTSIISETIFENRFKHVDELIRMGANIIVNGRVAIIKGVKKLTGANVNATDLRGGAALIIAGLAADGITVIKGIHHIDRGYENIEKILRDLGANIKRID